MDFKKINAPTSTVTYDRDKIDSQSDNIYKAISIISKRTENYKENISFVAISSNDVINYPDDSPELMKKFAVNKNFSFPYLFDETQEVAKSFDAACTPDFFLYNNESKLVYRGQMDDSRPGNGIPVTGNDLKSALDNLIKNKEISAEQKPSIGCNIKWK